MANERAVSVHATAPAAPRGEIQALRAIAVLGVVLFHFWAKYLPGGYVGVDVFFVISGYLITSQLLRERATTGRISLPRFWARRIRRLLPASLLVLAATTVFIFVAVPLAQWVAMFREIVSSAVYLENWTLASSSVNYLESTAPPSLTQHFWSLSVEEQFYLVWPLLVLLAATIGRRRRAARGARPVVSADIRNALPVGSSGGRIDPILLAIFAVVTLASLGYSVYLTATDPAQAYFVTPTRAWEFGAGGILAVVGTAVRRPALRTAVSWLGLLAIAVTMLHFTAGTPFPGWKAALPVAGTLAVIWAGTPDPRWAPSALMRLRPVRFVGDISYSLYLWHWPLIIGAGIVIGTTPSLLPKLVLLAAALLLAWGTKRFIEDPIRARGSYLSRARPAFTYLTGATAMALVVILATSGVQVINQRVSHAAELAAQARTVPEVCFGAAALDPTKLNCDNASLAGTISPDTTDLTADTGTGFACDANRRDPIFTCHFGSSAPGAIRVALTGDSHAAMLLPVLAAIARSRGWNLTTYLGGGCVWGNFEDNPICDNRKVLQTTFESSKYAVVIEATTRWANGPLYISGPTEFPAGQPDSRMAGFETAWAPVVARGGRVIVIGDNPSFAQPVISCLTSSTDVAAAEKCTVPRSVGLNVSDAAARAAKVTPGVSLVDLTPWYCTTTSCPLVIGNVAAYYNTTHITETYAQTLRPYLERELAPLVKSSSR